MSDRHRNILALSAQIVAAHVGNNQLDIACLRKMIRDVFNTLLTLSTIGFDGSTVIPAHPYDDLTDRRHDHHNQNKSPTYNGYVHPTFGQTVFGDHLICMEDGLTMKMLKRHLLTVHGITPVEYRAKWNLPDSYPMVAADYARLRSSLALQSGLGHKPQVRRRRVRKASSSQYE
jgi:predicted transcriptional regulator